MDSVWPEVLLPLDSGGVKGSRRAKDEIQHQDQLELGWRSPAGHMALHATLKKSFKRHDSVHGVQHWGLVV